MVLSSVLQFVDLYVYYTHMRYILGIFWLSGDTFIFVLITCLLFIKVYFMYFQHIHVCVFLSCGWQIGKSHNYDYEGPTCP